MNKNNVHTKSFSSLIEENTSNKKNELLDNYSVSSLVQKILEHSFTVNKQSEYYEKLNEKIYNLFVYFLKKNLKLKDFIKDGKLNKTFLNGYIIKQGENIEYNVEKIFFKVDKYLMIFLPILTKTLEKDIKKYNISINSNEGYNLINNYIKKFLNIFLIYGDKLNFILLKNLLNLENSELELIKNNFLENTDYLDNLEFDFNKNQKGNKLKNNEAINQNTVFDNTITKKQAILLPKEEEITNYGNNFIYSSTYRYSYKKAYEKFLQIQKSKNRIENKEEQLEKISELLKLNLESEIKISFNKLYGLFLNTIDLNTNLNIRLIKIGKAFSKIIDFINQLNNSNIAFQEIKINPNIISYIPLLLKSIFNNKFDINEPKNIIFQSFLMINKKSNNQENDFNDTIEEIGTYKKNQLVTNLDETKNIDYKKVDINKINIDEWEQYDLEDRYKIFLNKIIEYEENGNIKYNNILKLNGKSSRKLIKTFSELHGYDPDIVKNQIEQISKIIKDGINIKDFISNDVNNILFFYKWWRFILLVNKYNKINSSNFYKNKIKRKESGLNDIIIKKLKDSNILNNNFKLDLNPKNRLHNLSSENTSLKIDGIFKSLSKGNINLKTYKIGTVSFAGNTRLYCAGENASFKESLNYINSGINACVNILQGNTIFGEQENNYIILLKQLNIIPDKLEKIKEKDKNNLFKLIESLKVSKSKIKILNNMLEIASKDKELIGNIFSSLLVDDKDFNNNTINSIGPDKEFGRAFIKVIKHYNGGFHKLGDLTRMRIKKDTLNELIESFISFIKIANESGEIVSIGLDDWTGHLFSMSRKDSGYRDLKAFFTLKSGNVVEFQFHFSDMLYTKSGNAELSDKIVHKLELEKSLLSLDEVFEFKNIFLEKTGYLPHIDTLVRISGLTLETIGNDKRFKVKNSSKIGIPNTTKKIKCDLIYHLRRNLARDSDLYKKLTRLERILFESAWSNVMLKYLNID